LHKIRTIQQNAAHAHNAIQIFGIALFASSMQFGSITNAFMMDVRMIAPKSGAISPQMKAAMSITKIPSKTREVIASVHSEIGSRCSFIIA
jgi:hypothetical protein